MVFPMERGENTVLYHGDTIQVGREVCDDRGHHPSMPRNGSYDHLPIGIIFINVLEKHSRIYFAYELATLALADDIHAGNRHQNGIASVGIDGVACIDICGCTSHITVDSAFIVKKPVQSERQRPVLCY